jgi:hypothetical protein
VPAQDLPERGPIAGVSAFAQDALIGELGGAWEAGRQRLIGPIG